MVFPGTWASGSLASFLTDSHSSLGHLKAVPDSNSPPHIQSLPDITPADRAWGEEPL